MNHLLFFPRSLLISAYCILNFSIVTETQAESATGNLDAYPKGPNSLFDSATKERLESVFIDINWNNIDIKSALIDLAEKCNKADPAKPRIEFLLRLDAPLKPIVIPKRPVRPNISSMHFDNTSIMDVLGYLANVTLCGYLVHKNCVIFMPENAKFDPAIDALFIGPIAK